MTRNMDSRLARLEAQRRTPEKPRPVHSIIVESEAEQAEKIATLIASGAAQKSDLFIVNMIVDPEPNLRRLGVLR